jgi:hypothetical protein
MKNVSILIRHLDIRQHPDWSKMFNNKSKRKLAVLMAGVAITGSSLLAAAPAQAYPSNCQSAFVANGGEAMCNSGGGFVQVVLGCQNIFKFWTNPTGPWVKVGHGASRTGCPFGYEVKWVGYYAKD